MQDKLSTVPQVEQQALVRAELDEDSLELLDAAASPNTSEAYNRDWGEFKKWCLEHRVVFLPTSAGSLIKYLTRLSKMERKRKMRIDGELREVDGPVYLANTIDRKLSAIVRFHVAHGFPSPRTGLVKDLVAGIRRKRIQGGWSITKEAAPLLATHLLQVSECIGRSDNNIFIRDRALLLLGWACAMRRSEITALTFSDLQYDAGRESFEITIRSSKTDKQGQGVKLWVAPETEEMVCPVRALQRWIEIRGRHPGPLFWGSHYLELLRDEPMKNAQVRWVMERWVRKAGLGDLNLRFSPHSLRAGFITDAVQAGNPEKSIMERSRHRSTQVFYRYVRIAKSFENNPQRGLASRAKKQPEQGVT